MKSFLQGLETGWRLPEIRFYAHKKATQQGFYLGSWVRRLFVR